MAEPSADPEEGVSISNGSVKVADTDLPQDTPMEDITTADEPNGAKISARPLLGNLTLGPPNLHPTITTWQWLFSASDMDYTPSIVQSRWTVEQERVFRWKGVQLIFRIGEYLRLHVTCTASIYFHRFYMRRALPRDLRDRAIDTFSFQEMAPTCVFLACKVEETHRKAREIIEATMGLNDRSPQGIAMTEARCYKPDNTSKEYGRWKDLILLYEERLLETLCFDLIVEQPHAIAIKACKRLETSRDMAQVTVVLLNAILQGAVSVFYDAAVIAAAAFQKACSLVEVDPASYTDHMQDVGTWYDVFDVDQEEVDEALPDIDEQLAFHNERLNLSRPANPTPAQIATPLANTTSPSSPLRTDIDTPGPVTSTTPRRHTHFASEEDAAKSKEKQGYSTQQTPHWDEQGEGSNDADASSAERDKIVSESRPMSRHGSKGASLGPPPPLGIPDSKAVKRMEEDAQPAVSDSKAVVELKEDPQPAISDSKVVVEMKEDSRANERVAALKVHQEQLQQEEMQREEGQRNGIQMEEGQHADAQPEEGEIESEEEGAL